VQCFTTVPATAARTAAELVSLSLSFNSQQFQVIASTAASASFQFYTMPTFAALVPSEGPIAGGTLITVQGGNFYPAVGLFSDFNFRCNFVSGNISYNGIFSPIYKAAPHRRQHGSE